MTAPSQGSHEEDLRLLRRTRLRLMGLSGLVTLVILVFLGAGTYAVVARVLGDSDQTAMTDYISQHHFLRPSLQGPEAPDLAGEGANLFMIFVAPDGTAISPNGRTPPVGLPDANSLASAAKSATGTDQRTFTAPDGTPYYVVTKQYVSVGGTSTSVWLVQFVQNRTAEARLLLTMFWILLGGGVAALLASLLAGYLYAGRALVPIKASIERRQAALQRQREFAANASHELRTPLTVIGASVEDLKRNRRSRVEDVGEALGDIEAEMRQMTALVEDMLLLARTDSGVVQMDRVPLDLGDIAADAASSLVTLGEERGVKVVLDPLPAPVTGDPLRLRQLVTILVDNAIRHSPAGATVEARVRPAVGAALLQVDDQGPGIKPENLSRIFERFWRADDAPAGGTGLGLAIAKWIVEQHGGTIGAVNRPGGGASFTVWLPNVRTADAAPDDGPKWASPGSAESAGSGTPALDPPDGPTPDGQTPAGG
jgi:signal transduction histidine kinase